MLPRLLKIFRPGKSLIDLWIEGTLSEQETRCLAMAIDITERKKIEDPLKKSEESLRESEKKLTLALENGDGKISTFENLGHEDDLINIEHHGGKIWVESVPGKGSTFCFTIPKI